MQIPPEILFFGEVSDSLQINSFDNIVIFMDTFDPSPKVEDLMIILLTESADGQLYLNPFFSGQSLPNFVDELKL
jgi:hypothetical protein